MLSVKAHGTYLIYHVIKFHIPPCKSLLGAGGHDCFFGDKQGSIVIFMKYRHRQTSKKISLPQSYGDQIHNMLKH